MKIIPLMVKMSKGELKTEEISQPDIEKARFRPEKKNPLDWTVKKSGGMTR